MSEKHTPDTDLIQVETPSSEVEALPLSVQYLQALSPQHLTPRTFENGGQAMILITTPEEQRAALKIYRTIATTLNGNQRIQDEIRFGGDDKEYRLAFEFDPQGQPVEHPELKEGGGAMQAIEKIKELSTVRGAKINGLEGIAFVSNGESWVQVTQAQLDAEAAAKLRARQETPALEG